MKRSMMILFAIASSLLSVIDGTASEQHDGLKRQPKKRERHRVEESDLPSGVYQAVHNKSSGYICDTLPTLTGFDMVVENSSDGQTIQLAARGHGWNETMAGATQPLKFNTRGELIYIGGEAYSRCSYFQRAGPGFHHLRDFMRGMERGLGLNSSRLHKSLIFCEKPERGNVMACLDPIRIPRPRGCKHFFTLKKTNRPVAAAEKGKLTSRKRTAEKAPILEPAKKRQVIGEGPVSSGATGSLIKIEDGRYLSKEASFLAKVTISTDTESKRRTGTFEIMDDDRPVVLPNFDWVVGAGFRCLRPELTDPEAPHFLIKRTFGAATFPISPDSIFICELGVDRIWLVISGGAHGPQHLLVLTKDRQ
ncbi:hypothetical protein FOZ60_004262 [Perkinsus olseni]|uniref:Sorl1p n=1 Tax=Perkinsus olseni TaxID=32597 RepID=A0A7J6NVU3_PEROL|nr:hypothetical protein FOZ60_004262 [Perkinsus olseni]